MSCLFNSLKTKIFARNGCLEDEFIPLRSKNGLFFTEGIPFGFASHVPFSRSVTWANLGDQLRKIDPHEKTIPKRKGSPPNYHFFGSMLVFTERNNIDRSRVFFLGRRRPKKNNGTARRVEIMPKWPHWIQVLNHFHLFDINRLKSHENWCNMPHWIQVLNHFHFFDINRLKSHENWCNMH